MEDQNQDKTEVLLDILNSVKGLIIDTYRQRSEVKELWLETTARYKSGKLTQLTYEIEKEQFRRTNQNIDCCLRSLDRQKKIALAKLDELEKA